MIWLSRWENGDLEFKHESVLVNETLDSLKINPDGIYVDGTLGGGGHSFKIIQKLKNGRLIGIDQDQDTRRHRQQHTGQQQTGLLSKNTQRYRRSNMDHRKDTGDDAAQAKIASVQSNQFFQHGTHLTL